MRQESNLIRLFSKNAQLVSAKVSHIHSLEQGFEQVVALCDAKKVCQLLPTGCKENSSAKAAPQLKNKQQKIIAAPALSDKDYAALKSKCKAKGFELIRKNLRSHLGGIDIGVSICEHGIAETGTLVLDSRSEELRLATMISELHVAILPVSAIVADSLDLEHWLTARMKNGPDYTAFITGASRTADIERVLALGVHGPLELHIMLLDGA